ncbi:MAG: chemotaxis protein CheW [Gammaproteobacteria bacterium]|jgi:twitching motility protein PilI|nr:chemotaxis protein CheW [Gammaproteobacteria bacterium]
MTLDSPITADALMQQLLDYESRALTHKPDSGEDAHNSWNGLAFKLHDYTLSVDVVLIDEIIPPPKLTPIPGSADWLLGLTNVRGNLITIIDLRMFLQHERTPITSKSQVLVTTTEKQYLGLLVDEIVGQRRFPMDTATAVEPQEWPEIDVYLSRVYNQNEIDWGVLDLGLLLHDQQFLDGAA